MRGWLSCLAVATASLALSLPLGNPPASAQSTDRTIEEIKAETLARSQTGAYPTLGIDPADARDALALINTRDADEWAAGWSAIGDRYLAKAKAVTTRR